MPSKSTQTEQTKQENEPWKVQAPFLGDAFNKAQGLNNNQYTGDRVAQFNPDQLATFQRMLGFSNGNTAPQQSSAIGQALGEAGSAATTGALSRLGAFNPTGGTAENIAAANSYADAAANPAAVDAVMRDARRQVSEGALPQIARSSAVTGNTMSSRRAISEGIVERGLAEKGADVAATMRQDAFNKGLTLAEGGRQFDNNSILQAMQSAGALGNSAAGAGVNALGNSITQQGALFDMANLAGSGQQAADQAGLDNQIAKTETAPWENLLKYFSVVGGQNWGGTSTGQSTTEAKQYASPWSIAGGLLGAAGSFMKSDRRAKTHIQRVGTLDNGLPVYAYRYKDVPDCPTFIGLMAQDVEAVNPEAVREINGVKHVNYELATQ